MPESFTPLSAGWPWLICSVLVAVIASNLAWLFRHPHSIQLAQNTAHLRTNRLTPWIVEILKLLYFAGLPFAALFWGQDAVIGRIMGLQPLFLGGSESSARQIPDLWVDWTQDTGWAIATAAAVWIVLALGWRSYCRALRTDNPTDPRALPHVPGWTLLRDATYYEIHWAFYRSIAAVAFGAYWGTWVGLAFTATEAALSPYWRLSFSRPEEAPMSLIHAMLSFASGALYLMTKNLWLAIAVHSLVTWGFSLVTRVSARQTAQAKQVENTQQEIGTL